MHERERERESEREREREREGEREREREMAKRTKIYISNLIEKQKNNVKVAIFFLSRKNINDIYVINYF